MIRNANLAGALFMTLSMVGFAVNDATIKVFAGQYELMQVIFVRGLFALLFIGGLTWARGMMRPFPKGRDRKLIGLRALGEVGATLFFLTALFNMPIANATAVMQFLPLAITLTALVMGEPVGWRRILAALVGLVGVLIIVRPGTEGFNSYSALCLLAVASLVLRDMATRHLSAEIPSLYVSFITTIVILLLGGVGTLIVGWKPMAWADAGVLAGGACFLMAGYTFGVMSMRTGDVSFTSPFRYTVLLWAIILGYVVFDETLDLWTIIGSLIVVAAGLFTFMRERRGAVK
ncbi:MAG: DMT family transporter [Pseudomonadota bacterium]